MKKNKKKEFTENEKPLIDEEFLDIADAILTTIDNYREFTVKPVKETAYKKLKMKELVQLFEDKNFYKFSKKQVCEICTEVVTRLSRQLSSVPSIVKPNKDPDSSYLMFTESKSNRIEINFEEFTSRCAEEPHPFFNQDNVGIHYLHSIMHELYHTLQNYNFYKFLEGMPYEKDTICSTFQDVLSGTYLMEFEDDEANMTLYDADLDELNANIFAAKMMDKFIEKDYFKNSKEVEKITKYINALVCDNYSKEAIAFAKDCYLYNRKVLSRVQYLEDRDLMPEDAELPENSEFLQINDESLDGFEFIPEGAEVIDLSKVVPEDVEFNSSALLTEEEIMVLKSVYQFVSGLDMGRYQAKMQDEIIRYEQEFSAYALGKTDEELGFIDEEEPEELGLDEDEMREDEQGFEPEK